MSVALISKAFINIVSIFIHYRIPEIVITGVTEIKRTSEGFVEFHTQLDNVSISDDDQALSSVTKKECYRAGDENKHFLEEENVFRDFSQETERLSMTVSEIVSRAERTKYLRLFLQTRENISLEKIRKWSVQESSFYQVAPGKTKYQTSEVERSIELSNAEAIVVPDETPNNSDSYNYGGSEIDSQDLILREVFIDRRLSAVYQVLLCSCGAFLII